MRLVLALFLVMLLANVSNVFAQQLMSLEEVESLLDSSPNRELKGYFMSVPRGTDMKTYDITIRGVLREPGLNIILFVTNEKIVAGMSGSPTYVNGKLIGAMGYSVGNFNFNDYSWGGISPISSMMEEAERGSLSSGMARTFNYKGMLFEPIAVGYHQLIPGFESLADNKFVITTSPGLKNQSKRMKNPVLKAGMPIVVDLIEWTDEKGAITAVSAMGTITYIDPKGKVFAFGHPFLASRNVVYSFRTAEVMGTIFSEANSFKLSGRTSDILGVITFDATYGISGTTSLHELEKLHHFNLEFKSEGKNIHNFNIKVADSLLTPLLSQAAFGMVGNIAGAPIPQEASVTQLDVKVELQGRRVIAWKELFASGATKFGPSTVYTSSYEVASGAFFNGIYSTLFDNKYGLKISNVSISADFIRGKSQVFKLGAYKFPNKVVWGQDPMLEILFVSQDNIMAVVKKVPVKIDWAKVEKPIYTKNTLDTGKDAEKVIQGLLSIEGAAAFFNNLYGSEKQKFMPEYFLGPEDFLANLASRLEITNQKVFTRIFLKSRSGLFDEAIANAKDIMPQDVPVEGNSGWHIISGGLKERKTTLKNEGVSIFYVDLPQIPSGYVIDQRMQEVFIFEVVLEK